MHRKSTTLASKMHAALNTEIEIDMEMSVLVSKFFGVRSVFDYAISNYEEWCLFVF